MKVRELIEELSKMDQERPVVMACDPEGNGYNPLAGPWEGSYDDEDRGEVYLESLTEEDRRRGYTEEDLGPEHAVPVVILSAGYEL